jgi:serine/threonine protein kinase
MVVRPSFTRLRTCTHEVLPWDTTRNRRITKRRAIAWMIGHGYEPPAMAQLLQPKQQLAGYEVDELVGRGGMGEVYRARQISMDRVVALKILAPRLAKQDPIFAKRFVDEARAAGRLNHPNIIAVHDVGKAALPGAPPSEPRLDYFSMEYVDGESVKDVIDRQEIVPLSLVGQIMQGMSDALVYAEAQGIVHRDIKPDNIMLTNDGVVKLADLGLALQLGGEEIVAEKDEQGRGKVMGTPHYMSPEQARALSVDSRSDQYSLGATLYHMLTGKAPFKGDNAKLIMRAHVFEPVPDPKSVNAEVPESWRQLSMKLMAKNPEERFANCAAMRTAVMAAISGHGSPGTSRRVRNAGSKTGVFKKHVNAMPPWAKFLVYGFGVAVVLMVMAVSIPWGGKSAPVPEVVKGPPVPTAADLAEEMLVQARNIVADLPEDHEKALNKLAKILESKEFTLGPARELIEQEISQRQSMLDDKKRKEQEQQEAALAKQRQAKSIELEQALAAGDLVQVKACLDFLAVEFKHLTPGMKDRLEVVKNQFKLKLIDLQKHYTDQLLAATSVAEIEDIQRKVTSSPLSPEAIAQINEIAEKRASQYQKTAPPIAEVDDSALWQEFAGKIGALRGGLFYTEVSKLAETEAEKFTNPDSKAMVLQFASMGKQALKTEGALRAYINGVKPEITTDVNNKLTLVTLKALDKQQVTLSLKQGGGGVDLKQDRRSTSLPLQQLVDSALVENGVSSSRERAVFTANFLWLWRDPAASKLYATIPRAPNAVAVAHLESKFKSATKAMNLRAIAEPNGAQVSMQYGTDKHPWFIDDFTGENATIGPRGLIWTNSLQVNGKAKESEIPTLRWNQGLLPPFTMTAHVYLLAGTHLLLFGVDSGERRIRIGFNNTRAQHTCVALITNEIGGFEIAKNSSKSSFFKPDTEIKVEVSVDSEYHVSLAFNDLKLMEGLQLPSGGVITPIIQAVQLADGITTIADVAQLRVSGTLPAAKAPPAE